VPTFHLTPEVAEDAGITTPQARARLPFLASSGAGDLGPVRRHLIHSRVLGMNASFFARTLINSGTARVTRSRGIDKDFLFRYSLSVASAWAR
jgi:hypothetical protein